MNPYTLEWFAAHEQLSDLDTAPDGTVSLIIRDIMDSAPVPTDANGCLAFEATWRAKLKFIRARAMMAEAERLKPETSPVQECKDGDLVALWLKQEEERKK